jgi:hypothetical protein
MATHICQECGAACGCPEPEACLHTCQPLPGEIPWDELESDEAMEAELGLDAEDILDEHPSCRVCGCDDLHACPGGCIWAEPDLCSRCAKEGRS